MKQLIFKSSEQVHKRKWNGNPLLRCAVQVGIRYKNVFRWSRGTLILCLNGRLGKTFSFRLTIFQYSGDIDFLSTRYKPPKHGILESDENATTQVDGNLGYCHFCKDSVNIILYYFLLCVNSRALPFLSVSFLWICSAVHICETVVYTAHHTDTVSTQTVASNVPPTAMLRTLAPLLCFGFHVTVHYFSQHLGEFLGNLSRFSLA